MRFLDLCNGVYLSGFLCQLNFIMFRKRTQLVKYGGTIYKILIWKKCRWLIRISILLWSFRRKIWTFSCIVVKNNLLNICNSDNEYKLWIITNMHKVNQGS